MNITNMEKLALQSCCNMALSADSMINDPGQVMSGLPEMMEEHGWSRHATAGVMSSLTEKGLGYSDDNEGNGHIFWPTDEGYRLAFAD
jgi:hypothetical protein